MTAERHEAIPTEGKANGRCRLDIALGCGHSLSAWQNRLHKGIVLARGLCPLHTPGTARADNWIVLVLNLVRIHV